MNLRFRTILVFISLLAGCTGAAPSAAPPDASSEAAVAETPIPENDASTPNDAAPKNGCTSLENLATEVTFMAEARDAAPTKGGEIADGTYVLKAGKLLTGPGGDTGPTGIKIRMTIRITGTAIETVTDRGATIGTLTRSGTKLSLHTTCPNDKSSEAQYTATPDSLELYFDDDDGTQVYFLEKR